MFIILCMYIFIYVGIEKDNLILKKNKILKRVFCVCFGYQVYINDYLYFFLFFLKVLYSYLFQILYKGKNWLIIILIN